MDASNLPFPSNHLKDEDIDHSECNELAPTCQDCMEAAEASYHDYFEALATGN